MKKIYIAILFFLSLNANELLNTNEKKILKEILSKIHCYQVEKKGEYNILAELDEKLSYVSLLKLNTHNGESTIFDNCKKIDKYTINCKNDWNNTQKVLLIQKGKKIYFNLYGKEFIKGVKKGCFPSLNSIILVKTKDNKKKKLLKFLEKTKDIIIRDIAYYNKNICAVGEDNSVMTRKLQRMDEYHKGFAICSHDDGKTWFKTTSYIDSLDKVKFISPTTIEATGMMEGMGSYKYKSFDRGKSWKILEN